MSMCIHAQNLNLPTPLPTIPASLFVFCHTFAASKAVIDIPERVLVSTETMAAAIQRRSSGKQRIVIDLFCGRASLAAVAKKLRLSYVPRSKYQEISPL